MGEGSKYGTDGNYVLNNKEVKVTGTIGGKTGIKVANEDGSYVGMNLTFNSPVTITKGTGNYPVIEVKAPINVLGFKGDVSLGLSLEGTQLGMEEAARRMKDFNDTCELIRQRDIKGTNY